MVRLIPEEKLLSLWINGEWRPGRGRVSVNRIRVNLKVVWQGEAADAGQVAEAVAAARRAFPSGRGCRLPPVRRSLKSLPLCWKPVRRS